MYRFQQPPTVDASATERGLMGIIAQIFAGAKTFLGLVTASGGLAVTGTSTVDLGTTDFGAHLISGNANHTGLRINNVKSGGRDFFLWVTATGAGEGAGKLLFGEGSTFVKTTMDIGSGSWVMAGSITAAGLVSSAGATIAGAAVGTPTALTSTAASIAINMASGNNFTHTLTENTTLAAPSNPVAGQSGVIVFTQHASSPKTLAFASFWKFSGGTIPTLTATNGAVDSFSYYVESSGRATCALITDVK